MVTPKGWESHPIGEFLEFKNGLNKGKEFFGYGIPIVNYMDVYHHRGLHASDIQGRVSLEREEIRRFAVRQGDVFFTRTSETPDEVGLSSVLLDNLPDGVFSGFVLRGRPKSTELLPHYCKYCFSTQAVREAIVKSCTYTTRALTNGSVLSQIDILIPSQDEQRRIADALNDIESLIVVLEETRSKKRSIATELARSLLTQEQRLPGFDKMWRKHVIGRMGCFYSGLSGKTKNDFGKGGSRYITFLNVLSNTVIVAADTQLVDVAFGENQNAVRRGDLFFNTSSETPEEVGMCAVLLDDLPNTYLNSFCFGFRLNDDLVNPHFLAYLFNSIVGRRIMRVLAQGATRYNLSKEAFSATCIELPELEEQNAIVTVLVDAEKEISEITASIEKYKQIRKGMMRELLTGHIRLVQE